MEMEMEMESKLKLKYLKNHQQKIRKFQAILQIKEFNIYEFVSVFNPLINTLLTSILFFTDNLRIIAILVTSFNILIAIYLSIHKYYLSNELPVEKRILIHNSNNILSNLRRLEELYKHNCEYNLENFQSDLYDNCLNTEAEMEKYISYKKYKKYVEKYMKTQTQNVRII